MSEMCDVAAEGWEALLLTLFQIHGSPYKTND